MSCTSSYNKRYTINEPFNQTNIMCGVVWDIGFNLVPCNNMLRMSEEGYGRRGSIRGALVEGQTSAPLQYAWNRMRSDKLLYAPVCLYPVSMHTVYSCIILHGDFNARMFSFIFP